MYIVDDSFHNCNLCYLVSLSYELNRRTIRRFRFYQKIGEDTRKSRYCDYWERFEYARYNMVMGRRRIESKTVWRAGPLEVFQITTTTETFGKSAEGLFEEYKRRKEAARKGKREVPHELLSDVNALEARVKFELGHRTDGESRSRRLEEVGDAEKGLLGLKDSGWNDRQIETYLLQALDGGNCSTDEKKKRKKKIRDVLRELI